MDKISSGKEQHNTAVFFGRTCHKIIYAVVEEHLGVPEIGFAVALRRIHNDRIVLVFHHRDPIIHQFCPALALPSFPVFSIDAGIKNIHCSVHFHTAAGINSVYVVGFEGCNCDGTVLPVQQVPANSMTPVHIVPFRLVRMVLVEHMVRLAVSPLGSFIHPAGGIK